MYEWLNQLTTEEPLDQPGGRAELSANFVNALFYELETSFTPEDSIDDKIGGETRQEIRLEDGFTFQKIASR